MYYVRALKECRFFHDFGSCYTPLVKNATLKHHVCCLTLGLYIMHGVDLHLLRAWNTFYPHAVGFAGSTNSLARAQFSCLVAVYRNLVSQSLFFCALEIISKVYH